MLRTLDPHSNFLDPKAYAQMRERQEGVYYGLGLSIVTVNDDITVVNLFEGTPAYRAGIRRGDVIAIVKGKSAKGGPPSRPSRNCEAPRARKSRFRFAGSTS